MSTSILTPMRTSLALGCVLALGTLSGLHAQTNNIAINPTGAAPAAQALLDISVDAVNKPKGLLIPRVANVSALGPIASLPQGLTVYQTGAPKGFYVVEYGRWALIASDKNVWDNTGNFLQIATNPNPDFFGTTDAQSIAFRTNNAERMRLTNGSANLGVGTTTPQERLDVNGALRIYSPAVAPPYSATNASGTVMYETTPLYSTVGIAQTGVNINGWSVLYKGHWGNVNGSGPVSGASANPGPGGWKHFENEYTEEYNKAWSHFGLATCAAGTATIPSWGPAPTLTSTPATSLAVSPFIFTTTSLIRSRQQFLFTRNELNVELAQVNGNASTSGLCAGQPVNSIAIWVGASTIQVPASSYWDITVKHVPTVITTLSGFDNNLDPAAGCGRLTGTPRPTNAAAHWEVFNLSTPFIWDGARNVVVEVAGQYLPPSAPGTVPVNVTTFGPGVTMTYYAVSTSVAANNTPCNPSPTGTYPAGVCSALNDVAPALSFNCGAFGAINIRPVIQFGGTTSSATATTTGNANYINYDGGFIVESTMLPEPWGRWRPGTPSTNSQYIFKGNATISAENGVYDDVVALNDHVFDRAFDGKVAASDAARFGMQRNLDIREMGEYTKDNHHLPTMKGRDEWNAERGFSLGDITNQLWSTSETQALYLADLHDRLNVLEMLTDDRPITPDELAKMKNGVCAMPVLTDSEKAALLKAAANRTVATSSVR